MHKKALFVRSLHQAHGPINIIMIIYLYVHYMTSWAFFLVNWPVSQYKRPRAVALASSACVDKTTKIITEFTRKDPFLHQKEAN